MNFFFVCGQKSSFALCDFTDVALMKFVCTFVHIHCMLESFRIFPTISTFFALARRRNVRNLHNNFASNTPRGCGDLLNTTRLNVNNGQTVQGGL